jgi:hypothetical protein
MLIIIYVVLAAISLYDLCKVAQSLYYYLEIVENKVKVCTGSPSFSLHHKLHFGHLSLVRTNHFYYMYIFVFSL